MRHLVNASALLLITFSRSSLSQEPPATLETSPPSAAPSAFQPFSDTEFQLLGMFGPARLVDDATDGAFILTFQHFSTWQYGYNYFFLDVESQPPWHFLDESFGMYFEYSPTLSLNRLGVIPLSGDGIINDLSLTVQLNLGYSVGGFEINRVFLEGLVLNWSVPGAPVFETHLLARQEHNYGITWQVTFVWLVPFSFGEFRGFADIWQTRENEDEPGTEDKVVLLSQPQLLFNLGRHLQLGAELELRHDFPGKFAYIEESSTWDFRVGPMLLFNF
jgi:hypothetical protein